MKRVRMMQDISGSRGDGRAWPPRGVEFEVDEAEARMLTHVADGSDSPLAVYAEERAETADAPEKPVETREEKDPVPAQAPVPGPPKQQRPGAGKPKVTGA
jgi:hypothetical protein